MTFDTTHYDNADEEKRYAATWQYIRKWKIYLSAAFIFGITLVLVSFLYSNANHIVQNIALIIFVSVTITASFINPICPRCGKKFFKRGLARDGTLKNKCVHCGLPKGALCDPDKSQECNTN